MTAGKTGGLHGAGPKQLVNNNNRTETKPTLNTEGFENFGS